MEVFVARQPIFNMGNEVYGYELLSRSSMEVNSFSGIDGEVATSQTITNALFDFGITRLTGGSKAFINFTKNMLEREVATLFPKENLVVEVLEDIPPNPNVLKALAKMKDLGFKIAMDDFAFLPEYYSFVELADIIKVDFLTDAPKKVKNIRNYAKVNKVMMLAEKVETWQDYERAVDDGYELFQGYYFSRPVIVKGRKGQPQKLIYLELLRQIDQPDFDFNMLTELIERDPILTYEVLRLVNSSVFYRSNRVESVRQALVLLGVEELKKWTYLTCLIKVGIDHPIEIVTHSLLRAKFLEYLALRTPLKQRSSELFLLGIVSMFDVLLDRPLEEVLGEIAVSQDIKQTLLKNEGVFANLFSLVCFYERAQWEMISPLAYGIGVHGREVADCYYAALRWMGMYLYDTRLLSNTIKNI